MAAKTVRYMATLVSTLKILCRIFPLAATTVRPRIPAEHLEVYDEMVAAVNVGCEMLLSVDLIGDGAGEN